MVYNSSALTYDSKAYDPALSPDGAYVAYMFRDGERESVKMSSDRG